MPIRRPDAEKFLVDDRIEAIHIVRSLAEHVVKDAVAAVKNQMQRRDFAYVEDSRGRVVGELRGGKEIPGHFDFGPADARAAWKLAKSGEIEDFDEEAFFDCVRLDKVEMGKFLGGEKINLLCARVKVPAKTTPLQLPADFKAPWFLDVKPQQLAELLGPFLKQIKKAA